LFTVACAALVVGALTTLIGPLHIEWQGHRLFKSSGLFRPVVVAMLFGLFAGAAEAIGRAAAVMLALGLLPLEGYRDSWSRIALEQHPIRQARDCVLDVGRRVSGSGLYVDVPPQNLPHGLYYHFRRVRPWERAEGDSPAALGPLLEDPVRPRPMLVLDSTYQTFMRGGETASVVRARGESPPMRTFAHSVVLLLPGPYAACADRDAWPARPR
jgi:hypothetical protein